MIVLGIVYAIGALCAWTMGALHIALTPKFEPRYSGVQVFWFGVFWFVVAFILGGVAIYVRAKRVRA